MDMAWLFLCKMRANRDRKIDLCVKCLSTNCTRYSGGKNTVASTPKPNPWPIHLERTGGAFFPDDGAIALET